MKKIMALLIISLLWGACTNDMDISVDDHGNSTEDVLVKLIVTVPAPDAYARTRATDHESLIDQIQVLVFEAGKYKYRVSGIAINNGSTSTSFTALLKSSSSPVRLLILANSTNAVAANEPAIDDSVNVVKKKIVRTFDNMTSDFPMYGEYVLTNGLSASQINSITGIKMLRAIARVDVNASTLTNFKLTGVKAYRANDHLQIIPNETGVLTVTAPSVPNGSNANVNSSMFAVADADANLFSAQLYLPEAASPAANNRVSGATCIVVEGYYNGSTQLSYYRMDFDPDNAQNAFGQILRNHKYIFNIKTISAPGWSTADDAANNQSAHITASIQAWDNNTIDMNFDGTHHFGVSTRNVALGGKVGSNSIIFVSTDLSDYTLQWADASGNPQGTASQSLSNSYFTVSKAQSGTQLVVTALQANTSTGSIRTQNFIITAQRWTILVNIQQTLDATALTSINLMTFNAGLGYLGTNLVGSSGAEARGAGLRGILGNLNDFGPNGTVVCGGYNLIGVNANTNNLPDVLFTPFDVIYLHYMSTSTIGNLDAQKMHNWVKAKKNRVLIVSYDASDVSQNVLNEVLGTNNGIVYITSNNGQQPYPLATSSSGNSYFTTTGPFTSGAYTPISSSFTFQNFDNYHGEIPTNVPAATGITPILMGSGGGIVVGVDYSRRIIYIGDIDVYTATSGLGGTNTNYINNTTGTINNDAAKLIANLFAWVTTTVLTGK